MTDHALAIFIGGTMIGLLVLIYTTIDNVVCEMRLANLYLKKIAEKSIEVKR